MLLGSILSAPLNRSQDPNLMLPISTILRFPFYLNSTNFSATAAGALRVRPKTSHHNKPINHQLSPSSTKFPILLNLYPTQSQPITLNCEAKPLSPTANPNRQFQPTNPHHSTPHPKFPIPNPTIQPIHQTPHTSTHKNIPQIS